MTSVPELEAQKRKVHEVFSKADAALHKGMITQDERDRILQHYYGTSHERDAAQAIDERIAELRGRRPVNKSMALVAAFSILMLSLFGVLFYSTGGITGAVILDITEVDHTYTSNASIPITLDGTTRINVSGEATGDVTIRLLHEGTAYLLYELRSTAMTPHASMRTHFLPGETVEFTAVNLSSAYLMGEEAILLEDNTIEGLPAGAYEIKLIIDDASLSQETLSFIVSEEPLIDLFNTCGDACEVDLSGNATLEIAVDGTLNLSSITLTTSRNTPPQLASEIPDASGIGAATIVLSGIFTDADGDALIYESTRHDGNTEAFDGETFTVSGPAGTYTYTIYASDMVELTPSNIFSVTLLENTGVEEVNRTANETAPQNETPIETPGQEPINTTANATAEPAINATANVTANGTQNASTLDCSDPDPNKRPTDCLNLEASKYFEQDIFIENVDRTPVAKVTEIGNLLIKGGIVEHSAGEPASGDFNAGYREDFTYMSTAWIDSRSGDLHLRGSLFEENANINPPAGSYTIMNRRGVHMLYIDVMTGDMYVRGNVIPYRRGFE